MSVQLTYGLKPAVAFAGMLADAASDGSNIAPMYNAEASTDINHACPVKFGTVDQAALVPTAIADAICGLTLHSHAIANVIEMSAATGFEPGAMMNVLRRGRMWAVCLDGCNPGDRLHVKVIGGFALRASQDGVNTRDCTTQGQWLTKATAGNLAVLEVDFVAK